MAPETQFSAGKIIDAAIGITRAHGIDAVTARSIAKELGCSVKPIFTAFDNMDDAIEATVERARSIFTEFMQKPYEKLSFMRIGLRWIDFARTEPNLYKLLFVPSARGARLTTPLNVFMNFEGLTEKIVPIVASEFGLSGYKAYRLYNQMIIHAHGMACILVSGQTDFTEQSIREIFSETVESLVGYYKKSEE